MFFERFEVGRLVEFFFSENVNYAIFMLFI